MSVYDEYVKTREGEGAKDDSKDDSKEDQV
jgi:hypothetical protein